MRQGLGAGVAGRGLAGVAGGGMLLAGVAGSGTGRAGVAGGGTAARESGSLGRHAAADAAGSAGV